MAESLAPLAGTSRNLIKQADLVYKLGTRMVDICENECDAKKNDAWVNRDVSRAAKAADEPRRQTAGRASQECPLLLAAGPMANRAISRGRILRDVEGLVKLVDKSLISSPTIGPSAPAAMSVLPRRKSMRISTSKKLSARSTLELEDLNAEATKLAKTIKKNFEELGV